MYHYTTSRALQEHRYSQRRGVRSLDRMEFGGPKRRRREALAAMFRRWPRQPVPQTQTARR